MHDQAMIDLGRAHDLFLSKVTGTHRDTPASFPQRMIDFLEIGEKLWSYTSDLTHHVHGLLPEHSGELQQQKVLLRMTDVRILPPVPVPPNIVCLGLNYRDHAEEARVPKPERPQLFSKPSTTIVGPEHPVVYPKTSTQVDYEVELAVIIGKRGKDIAESDAFDHIAGYTVFNDISARDIQFADKQWFRGKSFDTFAPTGPSLVFREQVSDPHNLKMELRVNGEIKAKKHNSEHDLQDPAACRLHLKRHDASARGHHSHRHTRRGRILRQARKATTQTGRSNGGRDRRDRPPKKQGCQRRVNIQAQYPSAADLPDRSQHVSRTFSNDQSIVL
jgi:2-keto-4-pentenoate hydratase/2-oxohepta-3-ene-1,7-dioic acid hydratase in catechol pathway